MAAGEIARELAVPHNTMSSHLSILSRAGLVTLAAAAADRSSTAPTSHAFRQRDAVPHCRIAAAADRRSARR